MVENEIKDRGGKALAFVCDVGDEKEAETKVLLLLHTQDEEAIINNISLGVWECLTKASDVGEFIQAIGAITHDEIWAERKTITKAFSRLSLSKKREARTFKTHAYKKGKGDYTTDCTGLQQ